MAMSSARQNAIRFFASLGMSSLVSLGFYTYGALQNHSANFSYLVWNLFLAWLPLVFALRLGVVLRHKLWSSWEALALSVLWLLFLPNSFYMISDFVHLQEVARVNLLFDVVMFTSFIYSGVSIGFCSMLVVHNRLIGRLGKHKSAVVMAITLLACSFAIYIGRDLRWNSWDVLTNPAGLLFDISDRVLHPVAYPLMFTTVISFFALLGAMYQLVWHAARIRLSSNT